MKQWLKAYSSGLYGSSPDIARRRQYRLNNLLKWQVPLIIASLPVLLLVAMVLFLAGLVVLLWTIHPVVAGIVTALTSLLIAFFVITTILPSFSKTCSYHSPQASAIARLLDDIVCIVIALFGCAIAFIGLFYRFIVSVLRVHRLLPASYDLSADRIWTGISNIVGWITVKVKSPPLSWRRDEQDAAAASAASLDAALTLTAYGATLDATCLGVAETCLARCTGDDSPHAAWAAALLDKPPHHAAPARRPADVQDRLYALVDRSVRGALAYAPEARLGDQIAHCAEIVRSSVSGAGWFVKEYYKVPDGLLGPLAVLAMGHAVNVGAAKDIWDDLYQELILRDFDVPDPGIRRMSESSTFLCSIYATFFTYFTIQ